MTNQPFISIILPVFNEALHIEACLKTLLEIDYPKTKYEIITVDNGSTDESLDIAQRYADLALVLKGVNVGAVRNFGVQHAKGDFIAFLDSDCLVPQNWLEHGINKLKNTPDSILGGNLYLRKNPAWIEKYWLLDNPNTEPLQKDLLGSCILIEKQDFIKASGFDENITSGEDSELSIKLRNSGKKIIIDRAFGVVHLGNPTTVAAFLKRQIWHSENYLSSWKKSIKDIMFWLVCGYTLGCIGLIAGIFQITGYHLNIIFLALVLMPPSLLTTKRMVRAKVKISSPVQVASIWLIDNLYLIGRSAGMIKGII